MGIVINTSQSINNTLILFISLLILFISLFLSLVSRVCY